MLSVKIGESLFVPCWFNGLKAGVGLPLLVMFRLLHLRAKNYRSLRTNSKFLRRCNTVGEAKTKALASHSFKYNLSPWRRSVKLSQTGNATNGSGPIVP